MLTIDASSTEVATGAALSSWATLVHDWAASVISGDSGSSGWDWGNWSGVASSVSWLASSSTVITLGLDVVLWPTVTIDRLDVRVILVSGLEFWHMNMSTYATSVKETASSNTWARDTAGSSTANINVGNGGCVTTGSSCGGSGGSWEKLRDAKLANGLESCIVL